MNGIRENVQKDEQKPHLPENVLVVIPVYNHTNTVYEVAQSSLRYFPNILIVDDGSSENMSSIMAGLKVNVIRHDRNLGKGQAILTAAEYALQNNKTHIITLDADGQHDPEQIPLFLAEIVSHPDAIVIGVRDFSSSNAPFGSRFGREFGNFWVRIQTGTKVKDIQSGFRAYPAFVLTHLRYLFRSYAFENEVVVRALWAGVAVREVPIKVYYPKPEKRISHFRKGKDNIKLTVLNTWLTMRSLVPWPHHQLQYADGKFCRVNHPLKIIKELLHKQNRPSRLALAGALGVFLGTLPLIACHTLAIIYTASVMRLNKITAVAASQICMPPLVPALCIELGYFLRFGHFLTLKNASSLANASFKELGYMGLERLAEWLLGSLILAPIFALIAGIAIYIFSFCVRKAFFAQKKII